MSPEATPSLQYIVSRGRTYVDAHIDWMCHGSGARCTACVSHSTTDHDIILSSVHFAADITYYPIIAGACSPYVLAELFLDASWTNRLFLESFVDLWNGNWELGTGNSSFSDKQ